MTCSLEYAPQLRSLGFRVTSQRMAILHVLRHASSHLSPKEVHLQARRAVPGLTVTTVYRTLESLGRAGLVWRAGRASGHLTYELAEGQHHHLICRNCGSEAPLHEASLQDAYRKLEDISGFAIDHEHISLSGLCPKCRGTPGK